VTIRKKEGDHPEKKGQNVKKEGQILFYVEQIAQPAGLEYSWPL